MTKSVKQTAARAKQSTRTPALPPKPKGKLGLLFDLLTRTEGATVTDMSAATGWQVHSVRGAMAGALKKARGFNIISEKTETGRVYRIAELQA